MTLSSTLVGDSSTEEEQAVLNEGIDDRLWLIQCKRERQIGPKALVKYLNDSVLGPSEKLHGLVFTAACDFSKKARDDFAMKCREMGIGEWHLWGKAELEDRLFRPENDHLLFAYFGISLTIRRRSQRADIRTRLAMKRKANRTLADHHGETVLLRSPDATEYPYIDEIDEFKANPQWMAWPYRGMSHEGLKFCVQRFCAYLSDDGKSWDAAMAVNDAKVFMYDDPWLGSDNNSELRNAIYEFWNKIPEANKAWLEVLGVVNFEDIMDIDELGDEYIEAPHIYAPFTAGKNGPFVHYLPEVATISRNNQRSFCPDDKNDGRIQYFPAHLRELNDDSE